MQGNPPTAHEDLTIEETLKTMRVTGEHRPGEQCILDDSGRKHWVADATFRNFLRDHGAEHPSNFLAEHGVPWTQRLFSDF